MNAHQRRVTHRMLERALASLCLRPDAETPKTLLPISSIEVARGASPRRHCPRFNRRDPAHRATHAALNRILAGWLLWSEDTEALVQRIVLHPPQDPPVVLTATSAPFSFFGPVAELKRGVVVLAGESRMTADLRSLPTTCGPLRVAIGVTLRDDGSGRGEVLLGGVLEQLEPGSDGTVACRLPYAGVIREIAFEAWPTETWDRRLQRFLDLFPGILYRELAREVRP